MDKRIINAVAGSGKTTLIIEKCKKIDSSFSIVIITYTIANQNNLRISIIKEFGFIPKNIYIYGYFEFLYTFCYLPFTNQKNKGMCFEKPHFRNMSYYTADGRIYSNRIAKYVLQNPSYYIARINKYFDFVFIDEMQDLTSDDFDWLLSLVKTDIPVMAVGDFYQSTFFSSIRGNKNKSLRSNYENYKNRFKKAGFDFDEESLSRSFRCCKSVCDFIREKLKIEIYSIDDNEENQVFFYSQKKDIELIVEDDKIKKLFYQKHYIYNCNSDNWGNSKGQTFNDVCVVLNATTFKSYKGNDLHNLAPATLAKFYVACSRTRGRLIFIEEKSIPEKYKVS